MIRYLNECELSGKISAISSKSYAHRMMLCAMLGDTEVVISGLTESMDIQATLRVATAFGAKTEFSGDKLVFYGRKEVSKAVADCIESGSTLRFSVPIAAALGIDTVFTGSDRLLSRPNDALYECLSRHGAKTDGNHVSGKLTSGVFEIDSSISSQYISGLLMALPLLDGDSEIVLVGDVVSEGYIDITLEVMRMAQVDVVKMDKRHYFVKGNQTYRMPRETTVPGDWSNAAFFLAAGAFSEKGITMTGLKKDNQGDAYILDILSMYGAEVKYSDGSVTVKKGKIRPLDVDIDGTPDLAPIISVLCAAARGKSILRNVERLKIKESDRLSAISDNLKQAGVDSEYTDGALAIYGIGKTEYGRFEGYNDHRMVMSAAILGSLAGGEINGAEAVKKSYPHFFEDFIKLGGTVK